MSFHALRDCEPGDDRRAVALGNLGPPDRTGVRGRLTVPTTWVLLDAHGRIGRCVPSRQPCRSLRRWRSPGRVRRARCHRGRVVPTGTPMAMLDALSRWRPRRVPTSWVSSVAASWSAADSVLIVVSESVDDEEAARLANIAPVDVVVSVIRAGQDGQAPAQDHAWRHRLPLPGGPYR